MVTQQDTLATRKRQRHPDEAPAATMVGLYGKDEMNLAQFCVGTLSNRRSYQPIEIPGINGSRWLVSPDVKHGLPTAWGEKLRVALMCATIDQGNPDQVDLNPYRIGQMMQVRVSDGRYYKRLSREMKSLHGLSIWSEGAWYDNGEKKTVVTEEGFHLIDDYKLVYEIKNAQQKEEFFRKGIHGWIRWGRRIKESLDQDYLMSFNRNLFFDAPPIAAKAYLVSSVFLWKEGKMVFDLIDFAKRIGLGGWRWPSEIKSRLYAKKVVEWAVANEVWKSEPRFFKSKGFWKIEIIAGHNVFTRFKLVLPTPISLEMPSNETTQLPSDNHHDNSRVEEMLVGRGIDQDKAKELAKNPPEDYELRLEFFDWKMDSKKPPTDPEAFLIWLMTTDTFKQPKAFKTRAQKEAAEKAQQEALDKQRAVEEAREALEEAECAKRRKVLEKELNRMQAHYGTSEREIKLWSEVLSQIRARQPNEPTFQTYLADSVLLALADNRATIWLPVMGSVNMQIVQRKFSGIICKLLDKQLDDVKFQEIKLEYKTPTIPSSESAW